MNASGTARERARAEVGREIKSAAMRQLAEHGSSALSLRAVARDLGLASSALYRYFPSRDALLTTLIVDAYDALADHAERALAAVAHDDFLNRWRTVCHAVRHWARANPHGYALVYGSPVPGYAAPTDTIAAGSRISLLLLGLVRDAWRALALAEPPQEPPMSADMAEQATHLAVTAGLDGVPGAVVLRAVIAWTQLMGAVSLELFGHVKGAFTDDQPFFNDSVDLMAHAIGFRPR